MKNYFIAFVLVLSLSFSYRMEAQSGGIQDPNAISAKVLFINYGLANGNDNMKTTNGIELGYTRHFSRFLGLTVPLKVGVANVIGEPDNVNIISIDGLLRLQYAKDNARVVPYAIGGAGYVWEKFENSDLQIPLGVGADIKVGKNSFVNLQGEYRISMEDDRNNLQFGLGYVYRFGKADADRDGVLDASDKCPNVPGVAALGGCPDADGDGIADADDDCPNEAGRKQTHGCPDTDRDGIADAKDACPEVAGPLNGCPDADGDGIADKDDQCPNEKGSSAMNGCPDTDGDGIADRFDECPTEAGKPENKGCPIKDRDGDGIVDEADKCPDLPGALAGCPDTDGDGIIDPDDSCPTLSGPMSNKGCPEVKKEDREVLTLAMRAVQFETGKATLKKESFKILDQIADILQRYPGYALAIAGHTDDVGDGKANQLLSENRAKACNDYLVSKGISDKRLTFAGYGESSPIASNKTSDGRSLNRRVEFNLFIR